MPSEEDWKVKQSAIIIINLTSGMRCVAYILQVNIFCQYGENDSVALVISAGLRVCWQDIKWQSAVGSRQASRGEGGLATSGERGQTVNLIHPGLLRLTEPWEERSLYGDGRLTDPRIFIGTRGMAGLLSRREEGGCWGLVEQGL